MKKHILLVLCTLIPTLLFAGNPNKTYQIKYLIDSDGYAVKSETTMTVTPNRIYILRNGEKKYWDCEYKGIQTDQPDKNHKVQFHIYYLTNKHVYITISDYKLVKHNGVFYYRITVAGQEQLAL